MLTWVSGRVWSSVNPKLDDLRFSLGQQCGLLTKALQGFDHPEAHREFEWDVAQALWTKKHIDLFSSEEKEIISDNSDLDIENHEKELIIQALKKTDNNKTSAAKMLGISRRTLHRKLDSYGIDK